MKGTNRKKKTDKKKHKRISNIRGLFCRGGLGTSGSSIEGMKRTTERESESESNKKDCARRKSIESFNTSEGGGSKRRKNNNNKYYSFIAI